MHCGRHNAQKLSRVKGHSMLLSRLMFPRSFICSQVKTRNNTNYGVSTYCLAPEPWRQQENEFFPKGQKFRNLEICAAIFFFYLSSDHELSADRCHIDQLEMKRIKSKVPPPGTVPSANAVSASRRALVRVGLDSEDMHGM
jgi:hypothetical protein